VILIKNIYTLWGRKRFLAFIHFYSTSNRYNNFIRQIYTRIDGILDQLGRAKYFLCLDMMSGFHQIELEETSRNITSFSMSNGSYRFTRLPYGLKITPNSFQRMRTIEFSGIEPSQAFLYMDDLIKNLKTYLAWTQVY